MSGEFAYLIGGATSSGPTDAVLFAPVSGGVLGTFRPTRSLPGSLQSHATIVAGEDLIVVGGFGQGAFTFEHLSAVHGARLQGDGGLGPWRPLSALPAPRAGHALSIVGDQLFCVGGETGPDASVPDVLVATLVDGGLGPWRTAPPIARGRAGHALTSDGQRLFLFGGSGGGAEFFDVQIGEFDGGVLGWRPGPPMRFTRSTPMVFRSRDSLHVVGGGRDLSFDAERFVILPSGDLQRQ